MNASDPSYNWLCVLIALLCRVLGQLSGGVI